jgi:hypothetical protein
MASKAIKGYKFVFGGKSRPGIVGVKPKSGGVVDEFKSRKLKQLGRTQRKLKSQDKEMGEAMGEAKKKGATRKDLVKGRKFQRDIRRTKREGDKLRKDVLRVGKAKGGKVDDKKKTKKPLGGRLKKPKPGSYDYQLQETMKPPYKRKEMKKGGKALKPVDKEKNPGLAKLPTHVRNKMGYMKKGGRVRKFPDLSGDGKVTKKDILMGRGVIKKKNGKKKFGGGKK